MSDLLEDPGPTPTTLHQATLRPVMILGAERDLVLYTGLVLAIMMAALRSWWGTALGIGLWFAAMWVYRLMAQYDPQLFRVYLAHLRYRKFYSGVVFFHRRSRR